MPTGTVKFFKADKGFGFIINDADQKDVFVHKTGLATTRPLKEGDKVRFDTEQGKKGLNAINVVKA